MSIIGFCLLQDFQHISMSSKLIKFLDNGFKAKDDVILSSFSNILIESILV